MNRRGKVSGIGDSISYFRQQQIAVKQVGVVPAHGHPRQQGFALIAIEGPQPDGEPVKTDHYTIVVCMKGSGTVTLGSSPLYFEQATLHIIPPQYVFTYQHMAAGTLLYCVMFTKEFLEEAALKEGVLKQLLDGEAGAGLLYQLPDNNFTAITDVLEHMYVQCGLQDAFALPIVQLQLLQLLYEIQRLHAGQMVQPVKQLSRGYQLVHQYQQLVEEKFGEVKSVQEYAQLLHVTPKYLSELVKEETGEAALHVIHRRVYREAQYLLQYTQASIKEVADQLNFDTPSHFSRFFKQFAGYNPSDLKKQLLLPDSAA